MRVSTESMTTERCERLDEAFSECLARVVNLRPILFVKSGAHTSVVYEDPPVRDARIHCRSCGGAMRGSDRGRVLCRGCRANPTVLESAPLITTMYHHANPKYVLGEQAKGIVAFIGGQREIAQKSLHVAQYYAYLARNVHERFRRHKGNRNVHFTPDRVRDCSYERELAYCNPRYSGEAEPDGRHPMVKLGGLGVQLFDLVNQAACTWLDNLDAMIRAHFGISLERRPNDSSVLDTIQHFAALIARRVTLLETRDDDDPTTHLCTQGFEWVAKIQFVKCEHHAARRRFRDIRAMRELMGLARAESPPADPAPLVGFLAAPCPELLRVLPSVAADMRFGALCEALAHGHDERAAALDDWRAAIAPESLCMLLESAIHHAQQWQPTHFLNCLRRHTKPATRALPAQGWVDSADIAHWALVSRVLHAQRRTGLDATGLRIVLMSSALMQLSGDGHFFVPGVMRCEMMWRACGVQEKISSHAYHTLSGQMWPYMAGEPWRASREQMLKWEGSHMEDDLREAASFLGGFSMNEIAWRFAQRADLPPELNLHGKLASMATRKMVHKPPEAQYDEWYPITVNLLLPILAQLRQDAGLGRGVVADPLAGVLWLLKVVREWTPADGDLRITAGEAYATPGLKGALVRLLGEGSPLVRFTRPKRSSVNCWILERGALARLLNK
jgi:hypothetical protein